MTAQGFSVYWYGSFCAFSSQLCETTKIVQTFKTFLPFFQKWGCIPDDFQALYQQGLVDLDQPDFSSTWHLLVAWGTKP
jgi:hypothetical protein